MEALDPTENPVAENTASPHLSLVIPAYNEAARIELTLNKTISYLQKQSFGWEVVVVDDGSQDNTAEIAQQAAKDTQGVRIIRVYPNRGKGHALKTGVLQTRGQFVGFMDADYKTDITCTADALAQLHSGWDIAIGSRKTEGARIGVQPRIYRRIGSVLFNKYLHILLPILSQYKDTQCGFKFFTRLAAREIFSRQVIERFMFDAETLYLAHRLGFRVCEIPVRWSSDHDTRTRIIESIVRNTLDLVRIRRTHRNVSILSNLPPENTQC